MDFICFAARLKCYYEGGVGLQKTLNHAGPNKRPSGMSMPGDSDSDDDDDDEEDEEEEDSGSFHDDVDDDSDADEGDGNLQEEPRKEEKETGQQGKQEEGGSNAGSGSGPGPGSGSGAEPVATNLATVAGTQFARVEEASSANRRVTSGSNIESTEVTGKNDNVDLGESWSRTQSSGVLDAGVQAQPSQQQDAAKTVAGERDPACAAAPASSAPAAEPLAKTRSPRPRVSRTPSKAALDVISVSSVSAALSAAVKAVSMSVDMPGDVSPEGKNHQRAPTE